MLEKNFKLEHYDYPYEEGDDYWTIELLDGKEYEDNSGFFQRGICAVQSCWDDQSELLHRENPKKEYYSSLEDVLQFAKYCYDFIKIECFDSGMDDIKNGDYFVAFDDEMSKFQKSY